MSALASSTWQGSLGSVLGIGIERPADIVQGAQWLAEERAALEDERNNTDSQLTDLLCALSKAAAHNPEVVKVLPDIRTAVDPAVANRLDTTLKYCAVEGASSTSGPQDAAAGGSAAG